MSSVLGAAAQAEVGKAAGANSMLREPGGVFGIAILVAVFAEAGGYASAKAFSDGLAAAIAVSAALSLVGAIVGLGLPGRPRATRATGAGRRQQRVGAVKPDIGRQAAADRDPTAGGSASTTWSGCWRRISLRGSTSMVCIGSRARNAGKHRTERERT
jgi:hypothetical protein